MTIGPDGIAYYPWAHGDTLVASALNAAITQASAPSIAVPTTPVATDTPTLVADVDMLRAYGFVGGGAGTQLSSKFATLAAAQAVYPHAVALTDTLDWAAIQGLINAVNASSANGIAIAFPAGDVVINRTIVSGAKAVFMRGVGPFSTRILCNVAGIDLFQHGLSVQNIQAAFELQDLGLYCPVQGALYAINIRQNMNSGLFRLDNVRFSSFSANFSWLGYATCEGVTNTVMRNVYASGGEYNPPANQANATKVGFTFYSPDNNNRAFVFLIDGCTIGAVQNAFFFNITGSSGNVGSLEGAIFTNCGGTTQTGAWLKIALPNAPGLWWPPYFILDKCNMQGGGALIDADAVSDFYMARCFMVIDPLQSGVTATDYISIRQLRRGWFAENDFALMAGANVHNVINVGAGSQDVVFRDNLFRFDDPSAIATGGITSDPSNVRITSSGNTFVAWPAVPTETNTGTGTLVMHGGLQVDTINSSGNIIASGASGVIGGFIEVGAGGPTWTTGAGAPSGTQPAGSLYSRTAGATGSRLYVSAGGGTWAAVAGV